MTQQLSFRVVGDPKPQGSKRLLGGGVMVESGGAALKTWRHDVLMTAIDAIAKDEFNPDGGPVEVHIMFSLRRPRSHFGTGRNAAKIKDSAPLYHAQRPDVDKLARAVLDALTAARAVTDDSTVAYLSATKTWCDEDELPGAYVSILTLNRVPA